MGKLTPTHPHSLITTMEGQQMEYKEHMKELCDELNGISPLLYELMQDPPHRKIGRIKTLRQYTGLDLKDSKTIMDNLNDKIPTFSKEVDRESDKVMELQRKNAELTIPPTASNRRDFDLQRQSHEVEVLKSDIKSLEGQLRDYEQGGPGFHRPDLNVALKTLEILAGEVDGLIPQMLIGVIRESLKANGK